MKPSPSEVYRVDLGFAGKVRYMVVVSRQDPDPPRALALCVPLTTVNRGSLYEVDVGKPKFLRERSWAIVQGLTAIQLHEMEGPIGWIESAVLMRIRAALRFALDLNDQE